MKQHRDFLVNWVGGEEKRALVGQVFFHILIFYAFELESPLYSSHKWAKPYAQQLHLLFLHRPTGHVDAFDQSLVGMKWKIDDRI